MAVVYIDRELVLSVFSCFKCKAVVVVLSVLQSLKYHCFS